MPGALRTLLVASLERAANLLPDVRPDKHGAKPEDSRNVMMRLGKSMGL
jgi:hypothetical protein